MEQSNDQETFSIQAMEVKKLIFFLSFSCQNFEDTAKANSHDAICSIKLIWHNINAKIAQTSIESLKELKECL